MTDDHPSDHLGDPRVDALTRASRSIPVGPLDTDGVVKTARARRRRQRTVVGSALAAAVLVVGVAVTTATTSGRTGAVPDGPGGPDVAAPTSTSSAQPFPDAPAGSRWVGMNGVVVAVPDAWPVFDSACGDGSPAVVLDGTDGAADCVHYEDLRVSFSPHSIYRPRRDTAACDLSDPGSCYLSRSFAEQGISVGISVEPAADRDEAERVLASAMVLPDGWTTVPFRDWQRRDVAGRTASLEDAGFEVDASGAPGALEVRTDPPSGAPVREGATITLLPEGPAGDLTVEVTSLGYNNQGLSTGVALWDPDEKTVTYRSDGRFGCPPSASAMPVDTTVRLIIQGAADCGNPMEQMSFTVRGLDTRPDTISVVEDGTTTDVPVQDEEAGDSEPDFDIETVGLEAVGELAAGTARWESADRTLTYRLRDESSSCPPDPSGSFSSTRFHLVLRVRPNVVCDGPLGAAYLVRGLSRAPEELTVTERGEARTVPISLG